MLNGLLHFAISSTVTAECVCVANTQKAYKKHYFLSVRTLNIIKLLWHFCDKNYVSHSERQKRLLWDIRLSRVGLAFLKCRYLWVLQVKKILDCIASCLADFMLKLVFVQSVKEFPFKYFLLNSKLMQQNHEIMKRNGIVQEEIHRKRQGIGG